ncbi:glycogen/starch/alpha-glucan phosphorylase [Geosporobacter ferrireducens]|uniref:Alpha-1,4 glucan phosphorylase n=2 Tax=Geosporobacter ferrireducens TaxID=1424294 RepID=A0A1D8GLF3_9FIRM|nr:glycogen/starch/alpha-glucan phosphorylase [Geosporobacter ferrireducens]AOT71728.1 glycogen phosphorylase [Geosporobacter ferrireducens]MTI55507.1 glycogen/starch/alpha-glucan phosphorylase [Geosporobacter ferrireducens]
MIITKEYFKKLYLDKFQSMHGKEITEATPMDQYLTLGAVIRDFISRKWIASNNTYATMEDKETYYFSLEFLLGKLMNANLLKLNLGEICTEALEELGIHLDQIEELEPDAGLGNGGLGRLAACFLDSLAFLQLPGHGCGIRYKYGFFEQKIVDGYQVELPDNWLKYGNVWEIRKADKAVEVRFGGNVRLDQADGRTLFIHENFDPVLAVPYDTPIVGFRNNTINTLRLWSAETTMKDFDFSTFNRGDYLNAVKYKYEVESISQVLYPDDNHLEGRVLRLKQQYFFVSAGIQSIVRRYKKHHADLKYFHERVAIHINDTHPVLAIPELMRILIDEEEMGWDEAWEITTRTISYTNHTILPEALEKWPIDIFQTLLPRIYMIVHEINERFCSSLWQKYPGDWNKIRSMAVLSDGYVHMAHLAAVGSKSINGVAKIHTEILKNQVMSNFYDYYPHKFNNKTNGITPRRWLLKSNPKLAHLITDTIGSDWLQDSKKLQQLEHYAHDPVFQEETHRIKQHNKAALAALIQDKYQVAVDPNSIFDVQIKRIHGYKRQVLNVLHIMNLYNRLREDPNLDIHPRTFIFGGKAAPSYYMAKQTIKLINTLASVVNQDSRIKDKLKVIFMENYNVSLGEQIFPAADVSEQISTASKEASGTGNMKFMMNGAITIGTLDGANIEIKEEVGKDNIVIFGLTADQVLKYYQEGGYNAWNLYHGDSRIKTVLDQLVNNFLPVGPDEFRSIYEGFLYHNDEYFVLKDFSSYVDAHNQINQLYNNRYKWLQMSICNIAHSGKFSSDKTISEYARDIWNIHTIPIPDQPMF